VFLELPREGKAFVKAGNEMNVRAGAAKSYNAEQTLMKK